MQARPDAGSVNLGQKAVLYRQSLGVDGNLVPFHDIPGEFTRNGLFT
jgi:hypothetical protein